MWGRQVSGAEGLKLQASIVKFLNRELCILWGGERFHGGGEGAGVKVHSEGESEGVGCAGDADFALAGCCFEVAIRESILPPHIPRPFWGEKRWQVVAR